MTPDRLAKGARWCAYASIVVSFVASAAATTDYAMSQGVHPHLAYALPVCLELMVVVAAAKMLLGEQVVLARAVFYAGVATAWAVNYAHADGGVGGVLAALPALSLPVALHLALHAPARTRRTPARTEPRTRVRTPVEAAAHTNGHKIRTTKPTLEQLHALRDAHGTWNAVADELGVSRSQLNHRRRELGDLR